MEQSWVDVRGQGKVFVDGEIKGERTIDDVSGFAEIPVRPGRGVVQVLVPVRYHLDHAVATPENPSMPDDGDFHMRFDWNYTMDRQGAVQIQPVGVEAVATNSRGVQPAPDACVQSHDPHGRSFVATYRLVGPATTSPSVTVGGEAAVEPVGIGFSTSATRTAETQTAPSPPIQGHYEVRLTPQSIQPTEPRIRAYFATDQRTLAPDTIAVLTRWAHDLPQETKAAICSGEELIALEGFASRSGDTAYNAALSRDRARAVQQVLAPLIVGEGRGGQVVVRPYSELTSAEPDGTDVPADRRVDVYIVSGGAARP